MATLNVVFTEKSREANVYSGGFLGAANVSTSGTSAQSAAAPTTCFARCKASGEAMYVTSGSEDPTATVGGGALLSDGEVIDIAVLEGWKVAVIDAS